MVVLVLSNLTDGMTSFLSDWREGNSCPVDAQIQVLFQSIPVFFCFKLIKFVSNGIHFGAGCTLKSIFFHLRS